MFVSFWNTVFWASQAGPPGETQSPWILWTTTMEAWLSRFVQSSSSNSATPLSFHIRLVSYRIGHLFTWQRFHFIADWRCIYMKTHESDILHTVFLFSNENTLKALWNQSDIKLKRYHVNRPNSIPGWGEESIMRFNWYCVDGAIINASIESCLMNCK